MPSLKGARTRLVFGNVIAISLIMVGLGLALRFELRRTLLLQVDRELRSDLSRVNTVHRESVFISDSGRQRSEL